MKKKILVAVCCKDVHPIESTQCLVALAKNMKAESEFEWKKGALIDKARDMTVKKFLEGDYTHLMFIDDDIQFPADGVDRLLSLNANIAAAPYVSKSYNQPQIMAWDDLYFEDDHIRAKPALFTNDKIQKVDCVGMGFTLIRRNVIVDVVNKFNSCFRMRWHAGEDFVFCYEAKECGYNVTLDKSIPIYHMGLYNYGIKDYWRAINDSQKA